MVILVLTYRGLALRHAQEMHHEAARSFHAVLWGSSILYFIVTTVFNLLNLGFYATYNNSNATILGPMGIAMTSMMSARVSELLCSPLTRTGLTMSSPQPA